MILSQMKPSPSFSLLWTSKKSHSKQLIKTLLNLNLDLKIKKNVHNVFLNGASFKTGKWFGRISKT